MSHRRQFYLNKEKAKLAGVCAGVADYFDWNVTHVRIAWVIAAVIWPPVMIIGYIFAAWLAEPKPREETLVSSGDARPSPRRLMDAKTRFERLENRLRTLESVVTSREFQMDRELKGSGSL
tara:strand:- start:890 stop:1252 length:363 start_codon:yes stop_codon:yes gene_type:complete